MASTASLSPLTTLRMPAGRSGLDHQFREPHRHAGIALGRLQDESVAAGDGRAELPHRDHRREIERRDAGDDAERLAHRIEIDVGSGAVGELALHQMRNAAGEFDHLDAALDVALSVGDGLAVLARKHFGEADRFPCAISSRNLNMTRARRCGLVLAQAGCAALAFSTAAAHLALGGERDLGDHFAGHRLEDIGRPAGSALYLSCRR